MRTTEAADGAALVHALHEVGAADVAQVGRKAATLGRLVAAGLAVPEGWILDADAARRSAADNPDAALPVDVDAAIGRIAAHFAGTTLAVRSSAVAEDTDTASFAGQYETVLHVRGADALRAAIWRCWASANGSRLRAYRATAAGGGIAVLVQRQIDADVAGVAFTADPVTGASDAVRVAAVPGLADVLADGATEPDEWLVGDGVTRPLRVVHRALTEGQARAVAALARRVEQILGGAQDIEWAMADGRLVLLQARPITALPRPPAADLPPGTWLKEVERHPEPLTALGASLAAELIAGGLSEMSASCGGLIERFEARTVGGELYMRVLPVGGHDGPPPPWWVLAVLARVAPSLRRRMRAAERILEPGVLDGMRRGWYEHSRPHLEGTCARLRAVALEELDDAALATHLEAAVTNLDVALGIHFRLIPACLVPVHDLISACRRLLGWPDARTLGLLAGTSEATSAPVRDLDALAREVRTDPAALALVQRGSSDPVAELTDVDPRLGAALEAWCDAYACRTVHNDPGSPTLLELPWLITRLLADAVERAGGRRARSTASDELAAARSQLGGGPDRDRFETLLAAAQPAYPLREDAAFWGGSVPGGLLRLAAMAAGRRLAARGLLDRPEDVVHLPSHLVTAALRESTGPDALRPELDRNRAERAWVRAHPGPPWLGSAPTAFPDLRGLPAAGRRVNEALLYTQRRLAPPAGGSVDAQLTGVAASPGRYTGPVRIVRTPEHFADLRPGEVLVCRTTDPAWSVLFGTAHALVTEGGGVLSHSAIVAREYGIPAVVGTGDALSRLRDAQHVTVDGTAGQVHIHRTPSRS